MREKSVGNIDRYDELQQRRGAKKKVEGNHTEKRRKKKNGSIVPVDRVSIRFLFFVIQQKKKEAEG